MYTVCTSRLQVDKIQNTNKATVQNKHEIENHCVCDDNITDIINLIDYNVQSLQLINQNQINLLCKSFIHSFNSDVVYKLSVTLCVMMLIV